MLASQLKQETDWRVIHCEVLMDQSHTDTDEAFGNIQIEIGRASCRERV